LGGIVSSNVYLTRTAPRYITGHAVNLGFIVMGMFAATLYAILLRRENVKKEREIERQNSLPEDERTVYTVQQLRDLGDRAPEFVYTI
jgi:quinol-cytochrome oxidoreductase complex cytochrome b subunit